MKNEIAELQALRVSIGGALLMALIGLLFAWITSSEAILLDGVFSSISFIMAILTIKVAHLVKQPDDEHFHFGYAHFAPLINVIKSLIMISLCIFAMAVAVNSLLGGGRALQMGTAVVYGGISTVGCIVIAVYLLRAAKRSGSVLVELDARAWVVDALLSAAVLISFAAGFLVSNTQFSHYVDYLDPMLVTVLCLVSLPIPLKILQQNGREVLLFAPDAALQQQVDDIFREQSAPMDIHDYRIRMLKMGNTLNILVHVQLDAEKKVRVDELDAMRKRFVSALEVLNLRGIADVVFVGDMSLAE